jgi:hypothetical protein
MFNYLSPKDGPVFDGLEEKEVVFAKNQPQYLPLRALVSDGLQGMVVTRWTLTEDQRAAIARGDDLFLVLRTFGNPLQPIQLATGDGTEDHIWVKNFLLKDVTLERF